MTLIHLQIGKLEYLGEAYGFAVVLFGCCLHGTRRVAWKGISGEITVGFSIEWLSKWWTIYHWLPTMKRFDAAGRPQS